jgi:hypothetical protein
MKVYAYLISGIIITICSLNLQVHAQDIQKKSLLEQLEDEEKKERTRNTYQGQPKPTEKTLQNARENARPNTESCPKGSKSRNIEDVKEYISRHEKLQEKLAMALEQYTTKNIQKNTAINQFNMLIGESNEIVIWARGRVTDGACGPVKQTEIIGKAYGATKLLIEEIKKSIEQQ